MTENKRYSFNWERGHPNFWDNHCDLADCYLTCEDVVNRLNELNDKYNEIKEQYADDCNEANSMTLRIAELIEELQHYKSKCASLEDGYLKLQRENHKLKIRFKEERDTAMRLGSECDNLTIKNQKLELEILRLEMIIKTGEKDD